MVRVPTAPDIMAETVERQVRDRTFGQVRDLRIELAGRSVVLRGRVDTYYVKQLAQHAALDVLMGQELVNEIVVASLPALTTSMAH